MGDYCGTSRYSWKEYSKSKPLQRNSVLFILRLEVKVVRSYDMQQVEKETEERSPTQLVMKYFVASAQK